MHSIASTLQSQRLQSSRGRSWDRLLAPTVSCDKLPPQTLWHSRINLWCRIAKFMSLDNTRLNLHSLTKSAKYVQHFPRQQPFKKFTANDLIYMRAREPGAISQSQSTLSSRGRSLTWQYMHVSGVKVTGRLGQCTPNTMGDWESRNMCIPVSVIARAVQHWFNITMYSSDPTAETTMYM